MNRHTVFCIPLLERKRELNGTVIVPLAISDCFFSHSRKLVGWKLYIQYKWYYMDSFFYSNHPTYTFLNSNYFGFSIYNFIFLLLLYVPFRTEFDPGISAKFVAFHNFFLFLFFDQRKKRTR